MSPEKPYGSCSLLVIYCSIFTLSVQPIGFCSSKVKSLAELLRLRRSQHLTINLEHPMDTTAAYHNSRITPNDKFVILYGQPFMKVTPVASLRRSTTIGGALDKGDWFVVNLNTGELTVYSKARQLRDALDKEIGWWPQTPRASFELKIPGTDTIKLSEVSTVAITTLRSINKTKSLIGCTVRGHSVSKGSYVVSMSEHTSLKDFLEGVSSLYLKFV